MTIKNVLLGSEKDKYYIIGTNHLRNFSDQFKLSFRKIHAQKAERMQFVRRKEGNSPGNWRNFKEIHLKILRK